MWVVSDNRMRMVEIIDAEYGATERGGYVVATSKTGAEVWVGDYPQPQDADPLQGIRKAEAAFGQLAYAIWKGDKLFYMLKGEDLHVG